MDKYILFSIAWKYMYLLYWCNKKKRTTTVGILSMTKRIYNISIPHVEIWCTLSPLHHNVYLETKYDTNRQINRQTNRQMDKRTDRLNILHKCCVFVSFTMRLNIDWQKYTLETLGRAELISIKATLNLTKEGGKQTAKSAVLFGTHNQPMPHRWPKKEVQGYT